ncbi:MAG: procyclic acidic repetitive family protein, partial [Oscillospiraceae bacterium]|nr:procyclic acidic repetitive family protein [Oscillospiraceae bacterium]
MKRIIALIVAAVLLVSLAGCANIFPKPAPEPSPEPTAAPTPTAKPTAVPDVTAEPGPSVTPGPAEPPEPDMTAVSFELEEIADGSDASAVGILHAYNEAGDEVWSYDTGKVYVAQLDNLQAIGLVETGYLLLVDGDIVCVGVEGTYAGRELWRNTEFGGASANFDLDIDDNLYICGYFGPDLMVVDKYGKTVVKYEYLVDDYWPCELLYVDNAVEMTFESTLATYRIDPRTGAAAKMRTDPYMLSDNVVEVGTVGELMAAVADDTTIVLLPGEYNLTEWLSENPLEYYPEYPQAGHCYRRDALEGDELMIFGYSNLSFVSKYSNAPAKIVCDPRHATVLNFINCDVLGLFDLSVGHSDMDGVCAGNVIDLTDCSGVDIKDCDLYGCGAYALYALESENVWL